MRSDDGKWVLREACWGPWMGRDDTFKTGSTGKAVSQREGAMPSAGVGTMSLRCTGDTEVGISSSIRL